jgi:hypothetical protein
MAARHSVRYFERRIIQTTTPASKSTAKIIQKRVAARGSNSPLLARAFCRKKISSRSLRKAAGLWIPL